MAKFSEASQLIFSILGDRPVAYHPKLAKAVGGVKQAVFICQFLYWHGKGADGDGWIYKSQAEIEEETGLSRYEQETVRKTLGKLEVLNEKLAGLPATLHYRLDFENLYNKIAETYLPSMRKYPILDADETPNQTGTIPQTLIGAEITHKTTSGITADAFPLLPLTPLEASKHPDIQLFQRVSRIFPGVNDYRIVIDAVRFLRQTHPHETELESYLTPFWLAWDNLKRTDGKPANKTNPTWLTEWAVQNRIPDPRTATAQAQAPASVAYAVHQITEAEFTPEVLARMRK